MDGSKVRHYNLHPSGVECIDVVEHLSFSLGSAVKYVWRLGHKDEAEAELVKARYYLNREIGRIGNAYGGCFVPRDVSERLHRVAEAEEEDWKQEFWTCVARGHLGLAMVALSRPDQ